MRREKGESVGLLSDSVMVIVEDRSDGDSSDRDGDSSDSEGDSSDSVGDSSDSVRVIVVIV